MKLRTRHKPSRCPWCGSEKIALMLNGMPVFIPELEGALEGDGSANRSRRENEQPAWQCTECYAQFYRDGDDPPLVQDASPSPSS